MDIIKLGLEIWVDFFNYVGIVPVVCMVIAFYGGLWAMKKLPEHLEKQNPNHIFLKNVFRN